MSHERKYERKKEKLRKMYHAKWKKMQGYSRRDTITTTPVDEVLQSENERLQESRNPYTTDSDSLRLISSIGLGIYWGAVTGIIPLAILTRLMDEPRIAGGAVLLSSVAAGALIGYRRGRKRT